MTEQIGCARERAGARALGVRLLALAIVPMLCAGLLTSCGPSEAQKASAERRQCFLAQKAIAIEMAKQKRVRGAYPDVALIVNELHSTCPAGGEYSFDGGTEKVGCSVHGVAR